MYMYVEQINSFVHNLVLNGTGWVGSEVNMFVDRVFIND